MNRVETPQPGDELDALLTAFFRKEMPANWPAFQPPPSRPEAPPFLAAPPARSARAERGPSSGTGRAWPRRRTLWSSRVALAASVALLLAGAFFAPGLLPGRPAPTGPGNVSISPDDIEATRPSLPGPTSSPKRSKDGAKFDSSSGLFLSPDGRMGIEVKVGEVPASK
jgi:hypothetical protein